ncbi:hypothetical protein ABPG72_016605 [Tetrahymena utriculariae]
MSEDFVQGIGIIDGTHLKIKQDKMTFLLLVKAIQIPNSKSLNIMLADSSDKFWLGDFNERKIKEIKDQMKLTGTYQEFFKAMKEMLQKKSFEIELKTDYNMDIIIEFKFSGIIINARFQIGKPFKRDDNPTISYNLLKVFTLDLYNAYQKEREEIIKENQDLKAQLENINNQIKEGFLIKCNNNLINQEGVTNIDTIQSIKKVKPNTCIINPQRRKRKVLGAKIGSIEDD